jgi:hypothetical protein
VYIMTNQAAAMRISSSQKDLEEYLLSQNSDFLNIRRFL